MIKKLSFVFERKLNALSPASSDEAIIIRYGFELFFEFLIKTLFIIMLGVLSNTLTETLVLLLSFSLLRAQAGGIHAKTGINCLLGMIFIWGTGIVFCIYIPLNIWLTLLIGIVCLWLINLFAPQFTKNSLTLSPEQLKSKKNKALFTAAVILSASIIFKNFREVLLVSLTIETFTVVAERRKQNEKNQKKNCTEPAKANH